MTKNEENWLENYRALRGHVERYVHFPDKHTSLNNWVKYQRKRMKAGLMTEEQQRLFQELADSRSHEPPVGAGKAQTKQPRNKIQ